MSGVIMVYMYHGQLTPKASHIPHLINTFNSNNKKL